MTASGYTPFDVGTRDRIVGFFVIGAILLFLLGFLVPVIQRLNAQKGLPFYTVLDQTYGIAKDAPVSLLGVNIGKVTNVAITRAGSVRVDISLSRDYARFYTLHSKLTVNSNIGVTTILTGSGLILHPAKGDTELLKAGDFIGTEPPGGIASLLQSLDVVKLTDQITDIVQNMDAITTGINKNQQKIYKTMDDLQRVTESFAQVSQSLPAMVTSMNKSLDSLQHSLHGVDTMVADTSGDLKKALRNSVVLTEQARRTLAQAQILFKATTPVMQQLPDVLATTNVALQSLTTLSDQMSHSWLLGGHAGHAAPSPTAGPSLHPHDDSLYETSTQTKPGVPQ